MLTFNEQEAVLAGGPDALKGMQVKIADGRIAIAALHSSITPRPKSDRTPSVSSHSSYTQGLLAARPQEAG